jgi:UDP-N-acetylglucosamine--N-acetylmuramyl-(pentapeptide) pyrophosphoryl-undecaprenol N-acetylglucosamine transferase
MSQGPIVIAAGGTGGHLFPAQSLAEELNRRGRKLILVTDERGQGFADRFPNVQMRVIATATFADRGVLGGLGAGAKIVSGILDSWVWLGRIKPAVIVGFGGYPSLPAMIAGVVRGRKTLIHESNALLGRVNRALSGRVTLIASAFPELARLPAHLKIKVRVTGNPVRDEIRAARQAPYAPPTAEGPLRLLVFGGSQGAKVFGDVTPGALALLPEPLRRRLALVQQAREEDIAAVREAYERAGIKAELKAFFTDMAERLGAAHLVIARAGASSVTELSVVGRPSILVPLPSATDDHQTYNARGLAGAGGAVLLPQSELTPQRLADEVARLLGDPAALGRMAAAARATGRPDAQTELAELVEDMAGRN